MRGARRVERGSGAALERAGAGVGCTAAGAGWCCLLDCRWNFMRAMEQAWQGGRAARAFM